MFECFDSTPVSLTCPPGGVLDPPPQRPVTDPICLSWNTRIMISYKYCAANRIFLDFDFWFGTVDILQAGNWETNAKWNPKPVTNILELQRSFCTGTLIDSPRRNIRIFVFNLETELNFFGSCMTSKVGLIDQLFMDQARWRDVKFRAIKA